MIKSEDKVLSDGVELTPYLSTAIAEGFCEGESYTGLEDQIKAWAYLISSGTVWSLQGFFGRTATDLISSGLINRDGSIDWEEVYMAQEEGL